MKWYLIEREKKFKDEMKYIIALQWMLVIGQQKVKLWIYFGENQGDAFLVFIRIIEGFIRSWALENKKGQQIIERNGRSDKSFCTMLEHFNVSSV